MRKWILIAGMILLHIFAQNSFADGDDFVNPVADVDMFDTTAIAGVPHEYDTGIATIYELDSSGHWRRTATLTPPVGINDGQFGSRVALIRGRAVVASGTSIYLFVKQSSGAWKQTDFRTFKGADHVSEIDWQGNTLVVGVLGSSYPNYAFVYDTTNTNTLRKVARFAPADAVKTDGFGTSVAAHGSTVVVTAPGFNDGQGEAYLYTCGTTWCTQRQKILVPDGTPDGGFGGSVDMNSGFVVIGAPRADFHFNSDDGTVQCGKVYVFARVHDHVIATQSLRPTDDYAFDDLGVDLTIQGSRLVVVAPTVAENNGRVGYLYLYELQRGTWSLSDAQIYPQGRQLVASLMGQYVFVGAQDAWIEYAYWAQFFKLP